MKISNQGLLAGSSLALIYKIAGLGCGYLLVLLITRNFGAGVMGMFSLCTTIVTIGAVVSRFGMDTAIVKFTVGFIAENKPGSATFLLRKALFVSLALSSSLCLAFWAGRHILANVLFEKPWLADSLAIVLIALVPLSLLQILAGYLRGFRFIGGFAFLQHGAVNFFTMIGLAGILLFSDIRQAPLMAYVCGVFLAFIVGVVLCRRYWMPPVPDDSVTVRSMADVAVPLLLAASMGLVLNWTDILMLGAMQTEAEVGQYTIAVRLAMLTTLMLRSVNAAVGPRFAEAWQRQDVKWLNKEVQHSTRMIFWTSLPVLVLYVLVPEFFLGLFGDEFSPARVALILLSIGMFVSAISGSVGVFMQMTGYHVAFQNISFITVLLNVSLNALLIPLYGITGAAIASMFSMIFRNLFSVILIYRRTGIVTIYLPFFKSSWLKSTK